MGAGNLDREERTYLIEATYRIVGQLEKKFDALRESDREAFRMVYAEVNKRLTGFPESYSTKVELEHLELSLRELERNALSRTVYEERHTVLKEEVDALERTALPRSVFDAFVENYRIDTDRASSERGKALPRSVFEAYLENYRLDQDKAQKDRMAVVETLGHATNQVRDQMIQERGEFVLQESYDSQREVMNRRIEGTERWQYKIIGGLVFATFVAPLVTGTIVYFVTKQLG